MIDTKVLSRGYNVEMTAINSFLKLTYNLADLGVGSGEVIYFFAKRSIYQTR